MADTKHIAIYVRVSTTGQEHASQLPDLQRWAAAQDDPIVWYKDKFTGKSMSRKDWDRLMQGVRTGAVKQIAVWRLDRLGRTAKGLTALFEELLERKVNLTSMRDGIDLNTPAGRLMANVLASVAQYETEVRAERVRAGQAAARAKGRRWGGSKAGRYLKVTPDQEAAILQMIATGTKLARIARITGLSRPTIYRVVANQQRQAAPDERAAS
ncbi:MAG: DNA invertase Pin [Phycisphaerae bacterium]